MRSTHTAARPTAGGAADALYALGLVGGYGKNADGSVNFALGEKRIVLTGKFVHVKGDIHSPLGFFFFGKIILEGHHPVLVGDAAAFAVVKLMEAAAGIPDIPLIREGAVFLQRNVPAVGLIVDVCLLYPSH